MKTEKKMQEAYLECFNRAKGIVREYRQLWPFVGNDLLCAANTSPIFGLTPHFSQGQTASADTTRDGSGTLVSVFTGATNGSRIDRINIKNAVTTTAGMIRLYVYDLSNNRPWKEIPVDAITVGANTAAFEYELKNADGSALLWFPLNYILKFTTHNAENVTVSANGWDF